MLLLLNRHAIAAEQDATAYPDDSLRPLLGKGRRIQRRVSVRLREEGLAPHRVFSSPWKRAWQTARILIEESGLAKEDRIASPGMAAAPDLERLAAEIGAFRRDERIGLVGHEPWMSELAALLLSGQSGRLQVDFPKSGIMGIDTDAIDPGAGILRFFWRP